MNEKMIPFGRPIIGKEEKAAVQEVLEGTTLTHGPRVKEFEVAFARFTNTEYAIATATCMASLHLAYLAIELGPGDEVLVPAQTHVATAHAVEICGAKPVFIDADPRTGNIDLEHAASLITDRTRALSLVHYLGLPVDMNRVCDLAKNHNLYVVEDCAVALGATIGDIHVGLHGDVGCFSFYPVKHITTGEGGMVITRRKDIAEKVAKQRAFGIDKSVLSDRRHTGAYDIEQLGLNYRLSEIGAAIGIVQLERLNNFLLHREETYNLLYKGLREVEGLQIIHSTHEADLRSSHYCLSVILNDEFAKRRTRIIEKLKKSGIGTSVYYPLALPDTSYYARKYGYQPGSCPVASRISNQSIAFPVGPHVTESDAEQIIKNVIKVLKDEKY